MKSLTGLAALAAAAFVVGPGAFAAEGKPLFVYVSPTPLGVNDFLKLGKAGTERVAKELGGEARIFESSDPATQRQNLEEAANAGAAGVLGHGIAATHMLAALAQ